VSSNSGNKYIRFKMPIVVQHMLLTISAFGSMLSGYKIYTTQTVESEISWVDIHIIFGFLLLIVILWHLLYIIFTIYGHNDFMKMFLRRGEFKRIAMLGFGNRPKTESRFDLQEKVTYWIIGTYILVMAFTGLLRYAYRISLEHLPQNLYVILNEVHSVYGLYLGIILVSWHLYSIFLRPGHFPGTLSWLNGKVTKEERTKVFEQGRFEDSNENPDNGRES